MRKRKILQGENTLYLGDRLLHLKLWRDWWDTYGDGFELAAIWALPAPLLQWFFEMFEYAAGSQAATKIVQKLLAEDGPFQQYQDLLRSRLGARFFRYLAMADPSAALRRLRDTVGTWNKNQLLDLIEGRREIVWALEEIAQWRSLFADAARLLLALGEAETETFTNNAGGLFSLLFSIVPDLRLSVTEAPFDERFPIIREAVESNSPERRALGLKACNVVLNRPIGGRIKETHRIMGPKPDLWIPGTYGEMWNAYRLVWNYLQSQAGRLTGEDQKEAIKILLGSARHLGSYASLNAMVVDSLDALGRENFVDKREVLQTVIQILHYDSKNMPAEIKARWEQLKDTLTGTGFSASLKRFVSMDLIEDRVNAEGNIVETQEHQFDSLSQQALANQKELADRTRVASNK